MANFLQTSSIKRDGDATMGLKESKTSKFIVKSFCYSLVQEKILFFSSHIHSLKLLNTYITKPL